MSSTAKKIVAGNWKMNCDWPKANTLVKTILTQNNTSSVEIVLFPPFLFLQSAQQHINASSIKLGAQNLHQKDYGAFTGEISAPMLKSMAIDYVLVGHSERRQYFKEDNALLKEKVEAALSQGLKVMFCCGERLEERKTEKHFEVVNQQIAAALFHLSTQQIKEVVIAYEPVWAIGTGETASPEQAQEMHAFIRSLLNEKYDTQTAQNISILYGGSVKPNNAPEIFTQPDVDGGLIGGASLLAEDFLSIARSLEKSTL
ncbi:MAG: triose-phosphate isomerase [Flavobacteriaceae bacterium]|nr:triose-phosphate isomerase [Flavobacteriaceae bacterium]